MICLTYVRRRSMLLVLSFRWRDHSIAQRPLRPKGHFPHAGEVNTLQMGVMSP